LWRREQLLGREAERGERKMGLRWGGLCAVKGVKLLAGEKKGKI
jgi:hypothetical protein